MWKKMLKESTHLCQFLYRVKCHLEGLQLSPSLSGSYICETEWEKVFFQKLTQVTHIYKSQLKRKVSKLLCINTHRGLFKFERLPFGVKVAPAIFQQVMDTMLSGFDFVVCVFGWYLDEKSKLRWTTRFLLKSKIMGSNLKNLNATFLWKK